MRPLMPPVASHDIITRVAEPEWISVACSEGDARGENEQVLTQQTQLALDFVRYDFPLPVSAGVARFRVLLPPRHWLVRLRAIELYAEAFHSHPIWRCTGQTDFHGVHQPDPAHHWHLDSSLVVLATPDAPGFAVCPDPVPEVPRVLRLEMAVERDLSESLVHALLAFMGQKAEAESRTKSLQEAEAKELVRLLRLSEQGIPDILRERERQLMELAELLAQKDAAIAALERELQGLLGSRCWRWTAPIRHGRQVLSQVLKGLAGRWKRSTE